MKLSIIIPVFNGARTIGALVEALAEQLSAHYELEVVLVNDGSPADNSAEICEQLALENSWVKFLDLSRNFGEHNAVMAGLNNCTGHAAVIVDDDFQNPPSEVNRLVDKLDEGFDVVFARYDRKQHHALRNLGSKFNNLVASILIRKPLGLYLSSFKAINGFVIGELTRYQGPYPYIDGLILRITRNLATVPVRHDPRHAGESGYTTAKLVSLWLNMFTSFSILPLRVAAILGFLCAGLGFVAAVVFTVEKLLHPDLPLGWTSLIITVLILSGVQLVAIGVVGEYLGRLFMKDSGQPQFVIRRSVNCEEEQNARH